MAKSRYLAPDSPFLGWLVVTHNQQEPTIIEDRRFSQVHKLKGSEQGGITCGAIDEPRKSSKAIDERVIINFRDKNGVIARFRDKNVVIVRFCDKNVECLYIYYGVIEE